MKNKYTILLIILSIISGFIYIYNKTYDKSDNFYIQANKIDNNFYENFDIEDANKDKQTEDKSLKIEDKSFDKNTTSLSNDNIKSPMLININKADKETLKKLPGIGDVIAQNIIDYRNKVSLFYNIEDIKNVDRIGDKIYEKIKKLITIS